MWWIPVLIGGGAAYFLNKIIKNKNDNNIRELNNLSTLERNFLRISDKINDRNAIAIIGQPGAGKSTLLSKLTYNQCMPQPKIGQQTDATHWHDKDNVNLFNIYKNVLFVDTPGYDTHNHPVVSYINYFPFIKFDKIIFVVKEKIHSADELLFSYLKDILGSSINDKLILVRGFSEDYYKEPQDLKHIQEVEDDYNKRFNFKSLDLELIFLSNRHDKGLKEIKNFTEIE